MAVAQTADPAPTVQAVKPPDIPLTDCQLVRQAASKYSDWNADIITAIAQEEGYYQGIHCNRNAQGDGHLTYQQNGRTYGYSVSALQVRILPGREACDSYDINVNVDCAHAIWLNQGYNAWTEYRNGDYAKWL